MICPAFERLLDLHVQAHTKHYSLRQNVVPILIREYPCIQHCKDLCTVLTSRETQYGR